MLKWCNVILFITASLLLTACNSNNTADSPLTLTAQTQGNAYYTAAINGPVYQVISVQNNTNAGLALINSINLAGSAFSIVNRTGTGFDPAYGAYAQCASAANLGNDQVNTLAQNAQCIIVLKGAVGDASGPAQTGALSVNTRVGARTYNQSFALTNTTYLYVGGDFSSLGAADAGSNNLLAKCSNGICQNYLSAGGGANNRIRTITLDQSGNLYVGGNFTSLGTASAGSNILLAKCSNGACQNYLIAGGGADNGIGVITPDNNGQFYVGGWFNNLGAASAGTNVLLAQCSNGVCQNYFGAGNTSAGADNTIHAIAVNQNGDLYVGGDFSSLGSASLQDPTQYLLAYCSNGSCANYFGTGNNTSEADGNIGTLALNNNDTLYVGGNFAHLRTATTTTAKLLAKCINGNCYNYFNNLIGANDLIITLLLDNNDNLYAGGNFSSLGTASTTANNLLAKCSVDTCQNYFLDGSGTNNNIGALASDNNANLYVAGYFNSADTVDVSPDYLLLKCSEGRCENYLRDGSGAVGVTDGYIYTTAVGNAITASSS